MAAERSEYKHILKISEDEDPNVEFPLLLNECIVSAIRQFLSEAGMAALLLHLSLVPYSQNPRELHDRLRPLLGKGTHVLERTIVKELFGRLDIEYNDERAFDFEKFVKQARAISMVRKKTTD